MRLKIINWVTRSNCELDKRWITRLFNKTGVIVNVSMVLWLPNSQRTYAEPSGKRWVCWKDGIFSFLK